MECVAQLNRVEKVYQLSGAVPPVRALGGVDLDIPRGQYLAVMGPSGSGKSTLMNILGCLDKPSGGEYLLAGRNTRELDDDELSAVRGKHIGFIFQAFNLIPQLTVQQNVEVPLFYQGVHPHRRHEMAHKAIERVGLADRADHRPNQLSGGQMQRVAIARALAAEPSLLLADEPTGNLDSATGRAILDMFDELHAQGLTIAMVTHDPTVARRCQRVVRMQDGLVDTDQMQTQSAS
ncbi:MAG: ABC transporter ATP-binding protein [Phycisphaeraceae bacterium]|nr:ABC transporter ATP-binding protein [Phycisphaeraceae bacterium]